MEDDDNDPCGVVNPQEVKAHANNLDLIMAQIKEQVKVGDMKDLLNKMLGDIKTTLAATTPAMEPTDIDRYHVP